MCAVAFCEKAPADAGPREPAFSRELAEEKVPAIHAASGVRDLFQQAMESFQTALHARMILVDQLATETLNRIDILWAQAARLG